MRVKITFDRESDGRWIAEVHDLGVLVYGETREEGCRRAKGAALFALSGLADAGGRDIDDSIQFDT